MVPGFHLRTTRFSPLFDRRAMIEMDMVVSMQRNTACPVGLVLKIEMVHQCLWCNNFCWSITYEFYFCGEILLLSFACFTFFNGT